MKDYNDTFHKIIKEKDLTKYVEILLDYWSINPTTVGHGFVHVTKVAVEAYELGIENNYPNPEHLFIGGLFHDIYRPAEGKAGNEDQTDGAKITEELFNKNLISSEITQKIVNFIVSHDNWIGTNDISQYNLILSIADKITHNTLMAYGYDWASNKHARENNIKLPYSSHLDSLYDFIKYQVRAWSLFKKHPIKGTDRAIDSYLKIVEDTTKNYYLDKNGDHYLEFLENEVEKYRVEEKALIGRFIQSQDKINSIMRGYY